MPGPTIQVILVDGDAAFRYRLREHTAGTGDIRVIAEATNGRQVFDLIAQHQLDVVVLGAHMPSAKQVELIRLLRARASSAGILALLLSEDMTSVKAIIDAGTNGYALQASPIEEIIEAIRAVQEANQVLVQIRRSTWNDCSVPIARHDQS